MKATVIEETLSDNSTVFNVMRNGDDVANPISQSDARCIAKRINSGHSPVAACASLTIESELISDASETIGKDIAERIDEQLQDSVSAFTFLIEHLEALQELGIDFTRTEKGDFEATFCKATSALNRLKRF